MKTATKWGNRKALTWVRSKGNLCHLLQVQRGHLERKAAGGVLETTTTRRILYASSEAVSLFHTWFKFHCVVFMAK